MSSRPTTQAQRRRSIGVPTQLYKVDNRVQSLNEIAAATGLDSEAIRAAIGRIRRNCADTTLTCERIVASVAQRRTAQ